MNFRENATLVSRFASVQPDTVMPANEAEYQAWAAQHMTEASVLRTQDPLLHRFLSGGATASELSSLLSGSVSPVSPRPEDVAEEKKSAQVQALYDQKDKLDMTGQLTLMHLDQQAYDTWAKNYGPKSPDAEQQRHTEMQRRAEEQRVRNASKSGFVGRL